MARFYPSCRLVGLLLIVCAATALKCPDRTSTPGRELLCYTTSSKLDQLENALCSCTTLVHQGHDLQNLDASEWKSLRAEAKEANPDIRVVLSISDREEILKSSATTRREAATHLIEIINEVDGLELNATAGSKDRLVSFVKSLKDELANKSLERMILLVLPTKPEELAKQFELKELAKYVDLFTVGTHYLRDNDEAHLTFHPSRLMGLFDMSNTDSLVDLISGMGAPKQKIVISAPTRAYRFTLKKAEENTPRSATEEEKPVAIDRKKLCDEMNDGEWMVERDEDLTAPYAFKNNSWIAFEDETSLKIKGKYVILRELAGLALRDIEDDLKNDCGISPAEAVNRAFTDMKRKTREVVLSSLEKDLKGTEIAYPRHVRSSDFRIVRVIDTEGKIRAVRENTQTAFGCSRQGYFSHPKSCNRFYRCVKFHQDVDDYSVFEFDCPAGLAFDERTEVCVWPGSVSKGSACPGSSEIEPVPRSRFRCPPHAGFYADPQNCRWFFACYDLGGPEMVPFEFRCPFGLVFDEQRLMCEWPWKVPNCNGPGHGGEHSVYHYGGSYPGQGDFIPQGGIVGQGGFIGQGGYDGQNLGGFGAGANYDGQTYNSAGAGATYNGAGAGFGHDGQTFNAAGAGAGYDGQIYNNAGADGTGVNYDEQNYNVAGLGAGLGGQTFNAAGAGGQYDGPTYNAGGHVAQGFDGQTYDSAGGVDPGARYDGQTYNAAGNAGIGPNFGRPTYDTGANAGPNYPGQTYHAGAPSDSRYDGQTYQGANAGSGSVYGDNRYDGQNYNGGGIPGQGTNYNNAGAGFGGPVYRGPDCNDQNYNNNGQAGGGVDINNRFDGNTGSVDNNNNKGVTVEPADYDDQRGGTGSFNGQTVYNAGESGSRTTQFNSANAGTTFGVNNLAGVTGAPTAFTTSAGNFGEESATTAGYAAGETSGYAAGATRQNAAGFTTGFADNLGTRYTAGATDNNIGTNAFAGQTDLSRGVTSQNSLVTNNNIGTNFAGVTNNFRNTEFTQAPQVQNTNFNAFNTKSQTDLFNNNANTGLSTAGYDNNIENQNGVGFLDNNRPTVYNSTYSANPGYPSSTILPFDDRQNTFGSDNARTTPFNSVIYHSHVAMGLTSTEHFGTEYTNQAAKSFIPQGQNSNGYTYNGRTQNTQNFNTVTSAYDASRINSAGVTPSFNRGAQSNTGGPQTGNTFASAGAANFRGSAINTANYNTNADVTNNYGNSDIIGSSITSANNDIVQFRGTTESPNNYQTNQNIGTSTAFRNDNFFNQGTVTNQNIFVPNTFTRRPIPNLVTPASPSQNFNNRGTSAPGVRPLNNNIRPAVELDNSGLFGTNFAGPTTPAGPKSVNLPSTTLSPLQNTYRTNEYYDNGGRGTIRYNNGIVTNKGAGNDIQDYRTSSYTSIPSSFLINSGNADNSQSTIQQYDSTNTQKLDQGVYTKEGFTKTGPTRTGITTAQVGGSGSYVIGTGVPRTKPNPQLIGANAFAGSFGTTGGQSNFGSAGTTNFNAAGNNFGSAGTTNFNARGSANNFGTTNFNQRDETNFGETATTAEFGTSQLTNNLNTASGVQTDTQGYSYPRPLVQLEIGGNPTAPGVTQNNFLGSTTPSSRLNGQSFTNQNSLVPNIQNNKGFSTTTAPLGFTTNQLENFRTTVYQAANIPQAVSTVRPVLDNGFNTVISSTPVPAIISSTRPTYQSNDLPTNPKTYLDVGISFDQGNDYPSGNSDYSEYTTNVDQGNFGQRVTGQSTINNLDNNQNSQLITSTQFYEQSNTVTPSQNGLLRNNQANNLRARVNIPAQVYLSSSTIAPATGVTFRRPIVAADFSQQGQFDRSSTLSNSINRNTADFTSRGSSNRVLSNQASAGFRNSQISNSQGTANGILRNQASDSFNAQGLRDNFANNQGSVNFASRGSNRILNNQASGDFISRGAINNQDSARFASQGSNNGISNGQISSSSFSNQNQGFSGQTRTLIGSNVVTSIGGTDFNNDIIRQNVESNNNGIFGRTQQSTTSQPEVTTYSGTFGRTRSGIQSNSFDSQNQNRKVIVKLSDLHPLILGKLGAECTCKADPFAVFRGPNRQALPINSQNRGAVDLANYDESDIYVDVDTDKQNEKEMEFLRNIPSNRLIKTSDRGFDDALGNRGVIVTSRGNPVTSSYLPPTTARPPSSTYLPPARTSSTTYAPPARTSPTTYLPPAQPTKEYLPQAEEENFAPVLRRNQAQSQLTRLQDRQPLLIRVEDENANARLSPARGRSGKSLFDGSTGSANDFRDPSASFDRYGPGGLRNNGETLQGEPDCARPGLFRHPKFCNKFYACHWDSWKKRYTLHVFNCPVHLAFDSSAGACNYPTKGPACQDNKLLV